MRATGNCTLGPKNYTKEWHDLRVFDDHREPAIICGASDAGVICGLSKYKTRLQLYLEARCLVEKQPPSENMLWGSRLEPAIMEHFRDVTGFQVDIPNRLLISKEHPTIGASPDGLGFDDDGPITVDAKCTTSRMYDAENSRQRDCFGDPDDEPDLIPSDYAMQAQQQLLVTGAERCYFPVLFDGNKMRIYMIDKDEEAQRLLVQNIYDFVHQVRAATPPEPDFDHDTTVSLIKNMYGVEEGTHIMFTDEMVPVFEQYKNAKEKIGEYTRIKDAAQAALLFAMGDAAAATVPGTGRQMYRSEVAQKLWGRDDVEHAMAKQGQVKRKGFVRVTERKAK